MDKSHPKWEKTATTPHTHTTSGKYHDMHMEIKSNHPLANSYNYSLSVKNDQERGVSGKAELNAIKNPSPRGKGKDHTKHNGTY